jgi:5'-3' exoribonuclease 2
MGVPAVYRWLSEKYPKIVHDVLEDRVHLAHSSGSIRQPFDCTRPNPSGLECDNFYIDMNGIIHPCSHPEQGPQPSTQEEMYENVCRYVDRLFRTVRPRKLLYLAIDGVAPRAKMNQQRSRRFRSAQEARDKKELEQELRSSLTQAGHQFVSAKDPWDSNVITPGTKFMLDLSEYIRFYIRKRISTDKAWKNVTVIFSDASIPGEGEHKIMAHVRHQRSQKDYNPNLVHVLHGLDADLIMLALATHEAHFYILREEVLFGRKGAEQAEQRRNESGFADAQRQYDEGAGAEAMQLPENRNKPLQRISIPVLREYLAFEFQECNHVPFKEVSFERLLDDVVFLCFFVGTYYIVLCDVMLCAV